MACLPRGCGLQRCPIASLLKISWVWVAFIKVKLPGILRVLSIPQGDREAKCLGPFSLGLKGQTPKCCRVLAKELDHAWGLGRGTGSGAHVGELQELKDEVVCL